MVPRPCTSFKILILIVGSNAIIPNRIKEKDEIKIIKKCYPSASDLSNIMKNFSVSKNYSNLSKPHDLVENCGTFLYFPHFTLLFNQKKFSVTINDKVKENKLFQRRRGRALKTSYSTSFTRLFLVVNFQGVRKIAKTQNLELLKHICQSNLI